MFDVRSLIEMAGLPSSMKVASRMGDANVAVVDSIVKQVESTISNESAMAILKEKEAKLMLLRTTLGLGPKEQITAAHITSYKAIAALLDTI